MRMYRRLLVGEFLPFFVLGVLFFALILVLGDIFTNLWRYLNQEVPFSSAITVSLLYAPKALSYALPIGAMFAAAFTLGTLGARNELIAVFGSGVPLRRFVRPVLVLAAAVSAGGYALEDRWAIPMLKRRNLLSRELLGIQESRDRSRAAAISRGGRVIYYADYYSDETQTLSGLTVIRLDENGRFEKRIDAQQAGWDSENGLWLMEACRVFLNRENDSGGFEIIQERYDEHTDEWVDEAPRTFRLDTRELEEMNGGQALQWIDTQRRAGLPYLRVQAEFYQRFSRALTPFLVVLFAGALGGRFKRNILLMSLLASLGLSAAWYIVRMIASLLSEIGIVSPLAGAVVPYLAFLFIGIQLFRRAGT